MIISLLVAQDPEPKKKKTRKRVKQQEVVVDSTYKVPLGPGADSVLRKQEYTIEKLDSLLNVSKKK